MRLEASRRKSAFGPFRFGPDLDHVQVAEDAVAAPVAEGGDVDRDHVHDPRGVLPGEGPQQGRPADADAAAYIRHPVVVLAVNFDRQIVTSSVRYVLTYVMLA